ncbi:MAG: ATP-binding protein [Motiliproteus sp.]
MSVTDLIPEIQDSGNPEQLRAEVERLNHIISILMDQAERGINADSSDFSLFQTTIMLEDKVRQRTAELQQALLQLDDTNVVLEQSLQTLHQTQQQLIESEKMAALGHLVAGVAHEINTPVGVSVTATSHLCDRTRDIEVEVSGGNLTRAAMAQYMSEMAEGCGLILTNLMRANDLIQRFKQTAVDQATHEKRKFELGALIGDICGSLAPRLREQHVSVDLKLEHPVQINSYPGVIGQIITNLVVNSLDHAFDGGVGGRISIALYPEPGQVVLIFSDNGTGIREDVTGHIFEPFYTTRRGEGGTGLGLHISYNLSTEILGGTLECIESPASGAHFRLSFPVETD